MTMRHKPGGSDPELVVANLGRHSPPVGGRPAYPERRDPWSTAEWHESIAARLRSDDPPPELIVVSLPDLSKLVLLEGHVRLTAFALFPECLPEWLEVYLGISEEVDNWSLW